MERYGSVTEVSRRMGERNDCAVIAISITCRVSYVEAHKVLTELGRRRRRSTHNWMIRRAVESFGCTMEKIGKGYGRDNKKIVQPNGSLYTPKTIGKFLKRGYYICYSRGHAFAVVNGVVEDWTDGRKHQIIEIFKITKKHKRA